MRTMNFSEKQEKVSIYELGESSRDVVILTNEREVKEKERQEDGEEVEITSYEYDGNIFRTHTITAEQINTDPESYLDYPGDDAPSDEMVEYANQKIDEYTAQLMEEGLI